MQARKSLRALTIIHRRSSVSRLPILNGLSRQPGKVERETLESLGCFPGLKQTHPSLQSGSLQSASGAQDSPRSHSQRSLGHRDDGQVVQRWIEVTLISSSLKSKIWITVGVGETPRFDWRTPRTRTILPPRPAGKAPA